MVDRPVVFKLCSTEPFQGTPVGGDSGVGMSLKSRAADQTSSGLLLGLNQSTSGFKSTYWAHVYTFFEKKRGWGEISLPKFTVLRFMVLRL